MKELEFSSMKPWPSGGCDINDRMKVSQNHLYLAPSVKQKFFDQGCRLPQCWAEAALEGLKD